MKRIYIKPSLETGLCGTTDMICDVAVGSYVGIVPEQRGEDGSDNPEVGDVYARHRLRSAADVDALKDIEEDEIEVIFGNLW